MSVSEQFQSLAFVLVVLQLARYFDVGSDENVHIMRVCYCVSQVLMYGFMFYVRRLVRKAGDKTEIEVPEAKSPFDSSLPVVKKMTVMEYDLSKVKENLLSTTANVVVTLLILHYKCGFNQPLFLQSIIPLKNLFCLPIVKIHFFGNKAEGELKRPFVTPGHPFAKLFENDAEEGGNANVVEQAEGEDKQSVTRCEESSVRQRQPIVQEQTAK